MKPVCVCLLLLLSLLFRDVFAVPSPAVTVPGGHATSKEQQKPSTVQQAASSTVSAVTVPGGHATSKEQQKPSTVQQAASSTVSAVTVSRRHATSKEQQKPSTVQQAASSTVSVTNKLQNPTTVKRPVVSIVPVQRNMAAFLGKTITLPCRAPGNISIVAVNWTRPDLKGKYVLLFQDGKFVLDNQHPSFKNRVVLKDNQMKNGDLSVILKDVKNGDIGTYECRYKERKGRTVLTSESISTINLTVPLSDDATDDSKRHRAAMTITLSVIGVIAIVAAFVAVTVAIYRKCKRCSEQD